MRITLRQIAVLFAAAFLFAALLFNQSAVHWRADVNDSHYFAYCGWRIAHGAVPYLDVWDNKPPGAWWFNALAYRLFESDPWGEILICSAALLLTLLGFIAVARCIYHPSIWPVALLLASVLLTHIFYQCGANRTETFVAAAETLAVLGYLRWRRGGAWSWLALAGLSAGVAPLCKQAGIAALAAGASVALDPADSASHGRILELTEGRGVDRSFEAVGSSAPIATAIAATRKGGSVTLIGNLSPRVELPLQSVVTRQISLFGSCAMAGEYPLVLRLLASGKIRSDSIISAKAPLSEGAEWFARLYAREKGLLKVVLEP